MKYFFVVLLLSLSVVVASPIVSVESRNLKLLNTMPMLFEFHKITNSPVRQAFYYPQRDSSWRKNALQKEERSLLKYNSNNSFLAASLVGGLYYQSEECLADTVWPGVDGGIFLRGFVDSLEFVLDARIFSEWHSSSSPKSFDGEFIDIQNKEINDGLEYVSYARYRGHLSLNTRFARFDMGRDIMHWGPGFYNNLALNQFSLPFNSLSVDLQVGPLTVLSVYGDLRIYKGYYNEGNKKSRNLYAHRYELNFGNLLLGVSELQVVYDNNDIWLFFPIVPLFIEKGNYTESTNNGAISFDVNYRILNMVRLYTEFFLDDLQSPIELVKNEDVQSKWAWMFGAQAGYDLKIKSHLLEMGMLAEFARVEPFVYTHFHSNTAQLAHLEVPLGNQSGPNSLSIDWLAYSRLDKQCVLALHQKWLWKGKDAGSLLNDPNPPHHADVKKHFLRDAKMQYTLTSVIGFDGQYTNFSMEWTFLGSKKIFSKVGLKW